MTNATSTVKAFAATILVSACCLLCGCALTEARHRTELYERARVASVEVLLDGRLEGSGWFADGCGLIVTAAHVVGRQAESIEIVRPDGSRLPAEVAATDWGHDIALLRVDGANASYPFLKVADNTPAPGRPVYFYGSALFRHGIMIGGTVARDRATFSYFADRRMPMRAFHIAAPSPPGTSGGPWLDGRGRVVGNQSGFVTHRKVGAGIAIATPPDAIRRLVSTRCSASTATMGCGLEELWSQPKGFIKRFLKGTEGVVTIPIEKDGPAEVAGLHKESLIVAVDGQAVRYRDDVYELLYGKTPGDVVVLRILDPDSADPRDVRVKLGRVDWAKKGN